MMLSALIVLISVLAVDVRACEVCPEGNSAAPEVWGLVPSVHLRWNDLADCQSGNSEFPCFPPPPDGLNPVFMASIQRHGSRTPGGQVSEVAEFEGVVDEQLTRKGVSELHGIGAKFRRYFDEYLTVERLKTETRLGSAEALTCRASVANSADDLLPSVFIRSSTYSRTRLSGYAWAAGFDGKSLDGLVPLELLTTGTGQPHQSPAQVEIHGFHPFTLTATDAGAEGAVVSTVYPVMDDPLMQGNNNPFRFSQVTEYEERVLREPLFLQLQDQFMRVFEPLSPFMDAHFFSKLGHSLGDAYFCEVSAGAANPLRLPIRRQLVDSSRFKQLSQEEQERLLRNFDLVFFSEAGQRAVRAFSEGFRIGFYLIHTHPGFMHVTAGGALLLITRVMEAKVAAMTTGSSNQRAREAALSKAVEILALAGGFDYLFLSKESRANVVSEMNSLQHALGELREGRLAPAEQIQALERALRCLSILMFAWHDSLIIGLLGLLGNRSDEVTPFGSSIQLELLRRTQEEAFPSGDINQGFYVRLMFGAPEKTHREVQMPLCMAATQASLSPEAALLGKAGLCSLSALASLAKKHEEAYGGLARIVCLRAREHPSLRSPRTDLACALAGISATA